MTSLAQGRAQKKKKKENFEHELKLVGVRYG